MSDLANFIADKLKEQQSTQTELIGHLGDLFSRSPETARKWITGEIKKMPYTALEPMAEFLNLENIDRVEFYRLAGYSIPDWILPKPDKAEHGGMTLQECGVVRFKTMVEVYTYVREQIDRAEKTVCDLTWGLNPTLTESESKSYEAYQESILRACDKGVLYREVMTFYRKYPHYFERAMEFLQARKFHYNLSFFEAPQDLGHLPPLLSFIIVDERAVITCLYSDPKRSPDQEIRLAIHHPLIIEQFQDYFNEIWRQSTHLKEGDRLDYQLLNGLKTTYNRQARGDMEW